MPRRTKSEWPRNYSEAEKIALVTEIERRFQAGEGSLRTIAAQLGTCQASYYNWSKAGIKAAARSVTSLDASERERLTVESSRLETPELRTRGGVTEISIAAVALKQDSEYGKLDFRPVEVDTLVPVPERAACVPPPLTLSAPGGYRLEGLTIESAATLLRILA